MTAHDRTLQGHVDGFLDRHPDGWDHHAWEGLLRDLHSNGVSVSDPADLGRQLEEERLRRWLARLELKGLGPRRADALSRTFGSVWALRQADTDAIATVPTIPRALAERICEAVARA
ncbi:MAG: hypothetical protein KC645_08230 [Gemmatimonadetes bacterium]|nr:hypothetical protein [Gemmatimonadota bacterium]